MTLPTLHTERLELRPLQLSDADDLYSAMSEPVVTQYWYQPHHESIDVTWETLEGMIKPGAAYWALRLKGSEKCIGFVGFLSDQIPFGFGYLLHSDYWKKGLMTEAAKSVLTYAFSSLNYSQAEAWIHEGNKSSIALARKLGFKQVGQFSNKAPHHHQTHWNLVYVLKAHDYFKKEPVKETHPDVISIVTQLQVKDVQQSILFYTEKLGFRVAFSFGEPLAFASITPSTWSGSPFQFHLIKSRNSTNHKTRLTFTVENLDTLYEHYREKGVALSPIEPQSWDMREFTVLDPDGYTLVFTGI